MPLTDPGGTTGTTPGGTTLDPTQSGGDAEQSGIDPEQSGIDPEQSGVDPEDENPPEQNQQGTTPMAAIGCRHGCVDPPRLLGGIDEGVVRPRRDAQRLALADLVQVAAHEPIPSARKLA